MQRTPPGIAFYTHFLVGKEQIFKPKKQFFFRFSKVKHERGDQSPDPQMQCNRLLGVPFYTYFVIGKEHILKPKSLLLRFFRVKRRSRRTMRPHGNMHKCESNYKRKKESKRRSICWDPIRSQFTRGRGGGVWLPRSRCWRRRPWPWSEESESNKLSGRESEGVADRRVERIRWKPKEVADGTYNVKSY